MILMDQGGRKWLAVGAVLGAIAVGCGAFGAHGLRSRFAVGGVVSEDGERRLANWETAAKYQMYHALAVLVVGVLARGKRSQLIDAAGASFVLGTVIFSGCLYALVLTGQRWLGAVVPIGGMLLIAGWVCLAVATLRMKAN
jgi:uncharacterized membrane protein YgdD (TMEM256/DUF423 family)